MPLFSLEEYQHPILSLGSFCIDPLTLSLAEL